MHLRTCLFLSEIGVTIYSGLRFPQFSVPILRHRLATKTCLSVSSKFAVSVRELLTSITARTRLVYKLIFMKKNKTETRQRSLRVGGNELERRRLVEHVSAKRVAAVSRQLSGGIPFFTVRKQ